MYDETYAPGTPGQPWPLMACSEAGEGAEAKCDDIMLAV